MIIKTCLRATQTVGLMVIFLSVAGCGSEATVPDDPEQKSPGQISPAQDSPTEDCLCQDSPVPIITSADNPTRLAVRHCPLYSIKCQEPTIIATASNAASGLESIELVIVVGKAQICSGDGNQASALQCRAAKLIEHTCECPRYGGSLKEETCACRVSVTADDLVTYHARAIPSQGNPVESGKITFSYGKPSGFMTVPVWWHTGEPAGMPETSRIRLGLFPDDDYQGNFEQFAKDISLIVNNAFFNDSQGFARKYSENLNFFDIWAIPIEGANAEGCYRKFPDGTDTIKSMMSGLAILHHHEFNDCSDIKADGDGSGSVSAKVEKKPDWLLVHESAHFLFGLADEYAETNALKPAAAVSDPPNIFFDETDCANTLAGYPWDDATCSTFYNGVVWRIDDKNEETMKDMVYTSKFRNTSDAAIDNRIEKCKNGSCY